MHSARRSLARRIVPAVAAITVAALAGTGVAVATSGRPATTPPTIGTTVTASLDAQNGNTSGCAVGVARCWNLTAKAGTVALPSVSDPTVPIWGFALDAGAASIPGPTLVALAGENIALNVTNSLPNGTGNLAIQVLGAVTSTPDHNGVPNTGGSNLTSWTSDAAYPLAPGTYIYEAGPTDNGQRQVAMGLSGILVVRPADYGQDGLTGSRYALAGSSTTGCSAGLPTPGASGFSAETTVAINEINPEFNNNPMSFGLAPYEPKFFLINGHAFDATTPTIDVAQSDCLLVRYANLGNQEHSMGLVGARQTVIARDSHKLGDGAHSYPRDVEAEFLTPGQTSDALVWLGGMNSSSAPLYHLNDQIPLVDLGRRLHNDADPGLGGAAVMVKIVDGPAAGALGPTAQVTVTPSANDGTQPVHVVVTAAGASAAVYWIDTISGPGTPVPSLGVGFDITPVLNNGDHIIWAQATAPIAGAPSGDVFTWNVDGPTVYALSVDPPVTNGTTLNKTPNALPALAGASFSGAAPNYLGTLDFGVGVTPPLAVNDPINLSGFSPAAWNGNFTVASVGATTVTFSFGATNAGAPTTIGTAMGGIAGTSGDVIVTGTAEPSLADRSISAVSWCVDTTMLCGSQDYVDPLAGPPPAGSPVAIEIRLDAAALAALGDGPHHIQVTATEALFDWTNDPATLVAGSAHDGAIMPIDVLVDTTGPVAGITNVNPPAFGLEANTAANFNYFPSVRVTAHLTDANDIKNAELFLTAGTDPLVPGSLTSPWQFGAGTQMLPVNTVWTGNSIDVQADIPAAEFTAFDQGTVKLWVHGQDATGTWGTFSGCSSTFGSSCYAVTLDRTPPIQFTSANSANPDPIVLNPVANPATPTDPVGTLDLYAQDPLLPPIHPLTWAPLSTKIVAVEWFLSYNGVVDGDQLHDQLANVYLVPDYSPNDGTVHISMPIVIPPNEGQPPLNPGAQIVYRLRDAAGNYSEHYAAIIIP